LLWHEVLIAERGRRGGDESERQFERVLGGENRISEYMT